MPKKYSLKGDIAPNVTRNGPRNLILVSSLRWLDNNFEKTIIVSAYSVLASIIFEEVVRRFVFSSQLAWSTTIPIYLFILITWVGAAFNVRTRTHLSFSEVRARMPYNVQFALRLFDALLWVGFASVVVFYGSSQLAFLRMNYAIVPGTDNVMQWWFYAALPFGWLLIAFRAVQNAWKDVRLFRAKEEFTFNESILPGS